jgi:hypothetical protein
LPFFRMDDPGNALDIGGEKYAHPVHSFPLATLRAADGHRQLRPCWHVCQMGKRYDSGRGHQVGRRAPLPGPLEPREPHRPAERAVRITQVVSVFWVMVNSAAKHTSRSASYPDDAQGDVPRDDLL